MEVSGETQHAAFPQMLRTFEHVVVKGVVNFLVFSAFLFLTVMMRMVTMMMVMMMMMRVGQCFVKGLDRPTVMMRRRYDDEMSHGCCSYVNVYIFINIYQQSSDSKRTRLSDQTS